MTEMNVFNYKDRAEWLKGRTNGIGGSDASAIVGRNPYKTNIDLFEEKIGRRAPEDISEKPYVKYGTLAEDHIREVFALDYPNYKVSHNEWRILQRADKPYMQASLDGELIDPDGRPGILEIKTTNILQSMQREKWHEQIPENYYIQVLHYLLVTGYEFVILRADLKSIWGSDKANVRHSIKDYYIERSEVEHDLEFLEKEETRFWQYVESGRKPPLILPEI